MNDYIVWNIDPVIANIGPLQLRYYGILFATAIFIGFYLARRIYRKYGFPDKVADDLLIWGVVATVIGARLVHCLFYEPTYYLSNPLEILKVYKGGIASHGATVGLIFAVIFISRKYKLSFTDLADGVVFPGIMGATFVRLGNFFNSEIVGKITTVPWGFKFLRNPDDMKLAINAATGHCDISKMECLINYWPVRHPSQLYEAFGAFVILIIMLVVSCVRKDHRKSGLYTALFLILYFSFRFCIEFIKEYQVFEEGLTMGQYLSIPFIIFGFAVLYYFHKKQPRPEAKADEKSKKSKK